MDETKYQKQWQANPNAHAAVLTNSPYKHELEDMKAKQLTKAAEAAGKKGRKRKSIRQISEITKAKNLKVSPAEYWMPK
jgi:hypothetical protein